MTRLPIGPLLDFQVLPPVAVIVANSQHTGEDGGIQEGLCRGLAELEDQDLHLELLPGPNLVAGFHVGWLGKMDLLPLGKDGKCSRLQGEDFPVIAVRVLFLPEVVCRIDLDSVGLDELDLERHRQASGGAAGHLSGENLSGVDQAVQGERLQSVEAAGAVVVGLRDELVPEVLDVLLEDRIPKLPAGENACADGVGDIAVHPSLNKRIVADQFPGTGTEAVEGGIEAGVGADCGGAPGVHPAAGGCAFEGRIHDGGKGYPVSPAVQDAKARFHLQALSRGDEEVS